jgi:hypothetical protein
MMEKWEWPNGAMGEAYDNLMMGTTVQDNKNNHS